MFSYQRSMLLFFGLLFLLFMGVFSTISAQRYLKGKVVIVGEDDEGEKRAVPNVVVILEKTGTPVKTNSLGLFRLYLPKSYKYWESVTLQVKK